MSIDAIAVIREEAERLAAVLLATDPEQQVPTCPDWDATDLLWHAAEVHEFWAAILAQRALTEEQVEAISGATAAQPDDPEALAERRAAATDALLAQLETRRDDEAAWFWLSTQQNVGVIRRMQTHEAIIHRVDAELAAGRPVTPISTEVAHAGLDHVLRVMWPAGIEWIPQWARITPTAVIEIEAGGSGTEQLLISRWSGTRPRDGARFDVPVGRLLENAGEGDSLPRATVSGSPFALDLWAWGRGLALEHLAGGSEKVEIVGDPEAVQQLGALIAEGHD